MKRSLYFAAALLLSAGAQAQLYKSVGPDGKVTYSDTPPTTGAARVETRPAGGRGPSTAGLPYALAELVRVYPVVLYSTSDCSPCDEGRRLLQQRGIPFTEKTVSSAEDKALLRQASGGDATLPLLTIGRARERGYESGAWNSALSSAGYPETSRLPRNYRQAAAEALAPPKASLARDTEAQRRASEPEAATDLPPAIGNAPPGFRF
ncbi:MAG TPA: DUF4124 domain-containing protein [Noviherbaspirillum sp.]|jgi:glutaredoxin|uniref:DUF4124 domain-containing protein n=1 Tax=Noviherbaspirillum sp. TaxID=1926288 RepID=UPI002F95144F